MSSLILGTTHGILALVLLGLFVLKVVAWIDALIRPAQLYVAAGKQTKVFWAVILTVAVLVNGYFLGLAAIVAAIVYLVDVRPALRELRGGGRGSQRGWRT
jgi:hypothetical protein